ncbi:hypothetical protein OG762_11710 [Streptomyces sp. NBC_01136]|uniref:hypothetical protein n=1 Tax=unclassified Streptomyces TaxID=2593676 RepID=UPI00324DE619|nr:hypothetical protein OG762_11710 [Streptomyces sp. NBC_01136]
MCSLTLLLAVLTGCGGRSAPDTASADVQRVLDRRAVAVLDRNESAYRATGEPSGSVAEFTRLRAVPLAAWSYRLTDLHHSGDRATADAELRYRIQGYDKAPVSTARTLRLTRGGGAWRVASDEPAEKTGQQLWEQGAVTVVRGEHSLVLGVGQSGERLRAYAALADHAVPAVSSAWGTDWSGHVVVLVPKSLEGMAGLLGAPASGYRGIAAVTTGEVGGSAKAPADRVIVNPEAYGVLGDFGKQVVLTHETTHVATRAHTTAATPLWLSEGFADWVGYRGSGRTAAQAAPELERAVLDGHVPAALPDDKDFGFTGDAARLARAYEGGWMACRLIADRWGEARLNEFYRAVGDHKKRAGAVEGALRDVLHTTPQKFTEQWRAYLKARLG